MPPDLSLCNFPPLALQSSQVPATISIHNPKINFICLVSPPGQRRALVTIKLAPGLDNRIIPAESIIQMLENNCLCLNCVYFTFYILLLRVGENLSRYCKLCVLLLNSIRHQPVYYKVAVAISRLEALTALSHVATWLHSSSVSHCSQWPAVNSCCRSLPCSLV